MNFEETNRSFTLALRVCDAIQTRLPNQQIVLEWRSLPWGDILPVDIPPNSTFLVKHTFRESTECNGKADQYYNNFRSRNLFCNICHNSKATNVWNTNGLSAQFFTQQAPSNTNALTFPDNTKNNPVGSMQAGFLNVMHRNIYSSLATAGTTYTSFKQVNGGSYYCEPKWFECFSPENYSSIFMTFCDDVPVPTVADMNCTAAQAGQAVGKLYYGIATVGNFPTTAAAGIPNGGNFLPSFYQIYENSGAFVGDFGPPMGTHVFEFKLVSKKRMVASQF